MNAGHAARVVAAHVRVSAQTELAYRANFWTYLANTAITLVLSITSIGIVYGHVDSLGGWSRHDLLVVVGSFFVLGAFVNGVVHPSMAQLVADIRTGDVDYRLLKPVDAQLVAIGRHPDPWRALDLVVGVGVIAWALGRDGIDAGPAELATMAAATAAMLACACAIVAAFWALLASITFWTVQGEGILWALDDMYDHLRWPISIFPGGLRLLLSTVFPAGLAVTVPAAALTQRLDLATAAWAVVLTLALLAAARWMWHRAIRRYDGASA